MITVSILINSSPIFTRSAVNVGAEAKGIRSMYSLDDGSMLYHDPSKGAIALAIAMLKTIHEPKGVTD